MLKMVDGTGIIGVDMVCPLGGAVSPPQAPIERLELVGNSVQGENPAPDNLQEIKSAGRKSRNLFDITKLPLNHDGTKFVIPETALNTFIFEEHQFEENTQYTLSAQKVTSKNEQSAIIRFYYTDGTRSEINVKNLETKSLTSISGKTVDYLLIGNPYKAEHEVFGLQLEKGTTATDYEPYGYLLDVKVTGKNLFNAEKAKDANNWTSSAILPSYKEFSIYVGKGNSVNISYLENLETGLGFYANIASSKNDYTMYWLYHSDSEINITKNKNFIAMNDYIILRVDAGSVPKFFEYIKTLQIEIGSKQTPYEPYTEQSVQIALDEPLRGIGDYKDTITKDGVVRKIAPYEVNLNDLRDGGYEKTNTVMFSVKVQNKTVGYASSKPSILCNILPDCALQMSNIYNNDKECIAVGGGVVLFRVNKSRLKDISSFEATKQSFIELMADKKMIVEYALETPVTEPLPESVQAQLQALHTENGITHVFVDSGEVPCGIKLTYRKEK